MTKCITIRRELKDISKDFKNFLEDNMRYRRLLYNKGVEYIREIDHKGFNAYNWAVLIHNTFEIHNEDYVHKCIGIRAHVAKDLDIAVKSVWKDRMGLKPSRPYKNPKAKCHFKKYNPYEGSFKVENKHRDTTSRMCSIVNVNTLFIKCNKYKDDNGNHPYHFTINLKTPLYEYECVDNTDIKVDKKQRYAFTNSDIREFGFLKENKKYYIILVISVSMRKHEPKKKRKKMLGIDLGIHNPLYVYNGKQHTNIRLSDKQLKRIYKLEKRADKLNAIMCRKYETNKKLTGNGYSKNYYKVVLKYRLTWRKIVNIRRDWRYKLSHSIVTSYKNVCVDTFKQPKHEGKDKATRIINKFNRLHGMYLFTETLKYMCDKYNCNFIESPPKSTRTCSSCGHVNDKLDISKRNLKCKKCGLVIDRDENAARNCYHWGLKLI